MARQTFIRVLAVVLLALLLGWLLAVNIDTERLDKGFPWQIEILDDGSSQVFQINLGKTTLSQVTKNFNTAPEFTMFVADGQAPEIEAYFNSVRISGLGAKLVLGFDLPAEQLEGMYNRGVRISTLGSGIRKVTLHPDDIAAIHLQPVTSITYIPSINLDGALIEKRFGQPARRIRESDNTEHWLYPEKGLDIVLNDNARDVLQYVLPEKFSTVTRPLERLDKKQEKNNE